MAVAIAGRKYLVIAGKGAGHVGIVEAVEPDGRHCLITVGDKMFRQMHHNLAMNPAGEPIEPPGGFVDEIPVTRERKSKQRSATNRPTGTPDSKQGVGGQPTNPYRGKANQPTDPTDTDDTPAPPRQAVQPIASWPKKLPPFTLDDVEITERTPGPTFHELYQLDLLTGEGVGLVWRSKADGMWHVLGGAGSAFDQKETAINFLIKRRQPNLPSNATHEPAAKVEVDS